MASEELGAYVFIAGYGLMLLGAIRVFGFRRVMWVIFGIVFLAAAISLKTLGIFSSSRRS